MELRDILDVVGMHRPAYVQQLLDGQNTDKMLRLQGAIREIDAIDKEFRYRFEREEAK